MSGGRDSRHILFELIRAGVSPTTVTLRQWAPRSSDDLPVAKLLAKRFQLAHVTLPQTWRKLKAEYEKNILTDFLSDEHAWMMLMRRFAQQHSGTVFDGIGGDILSAGLLMDRKLLSIMEAGDTAAAADIILGSEDPWRRVLHPTFYQKISRDRAINVLQQELEKHLNAPNPVSSYFFWNRTRREISLFGFKIIGDVKVPYLDDDVYDHLTSLPASFFLDRTFHTETIHRFFPQFSDLPFDSKKSTRLR